MKSPWEFKNYGQSGIPVSSLFPNVATCVDDMCVVRSMVGEGVGPWRRASADLHGHQHFHAAEHGFLGALRPRY